jgi:RNA polymerase sigma factor (sigma-70 family)
MLGEQDRTTTPDTAAIPNEDPATADAKLALAARHDPRAFEELYLRYADRLFRFAAGLTGSATLAEDVVSDTMMAAYENLERFDPSRGSVASWLFTIARRRSTDEQRRRSRLWRAFSRHGADQDVAEDTLSEVIRSENAARLRAAIGSIPRGDREVLLLRYVADLSGPEIGEVLGISAGTVRVRIHRALKRLSQELGDHDAGR